MSDTASTAMAASPALSPWAPFRQSAFRVIWAATLVANIGGWMYSAASGRVTNADRLIEEAVRRFNLSGAPKVTHFIAANF